MTDTSKKPREFWIGEHCIILDEQLFPIVNLFKWHVYKSKQTYYARANVFIGGKSKSITMHRLITGLRNCMVDHRNRNGLDNRIENLRFCSPSQNSQNRIRKNKFGFRGVYRTGSSHTFSVQIQNKEKKIHKHGFKTPEDAAREYDKLSKELHGEFGIRNFED